MKLHREPGAIGPCSSKPANPARSATFAKKEVMRDAEPVKSEKLTVRALVVRVPDAKLVHPSVQFCRHLWGAASDLRLAVLSASPVRAPKKQRRAEARLDVVR